MMEDKKGLILAGAIGTALLGVLAALLYFMKPAGLREAHRGGAPSGGFDFPPVEAPADAAAPPPADRGTPPPSRAAQASPAPAARAASSASSLGFVRPASGLALEQEPQAPPPQAPAPPPPENPAAPLTDTAIRAIMQEIVDLVRRRRPQWHREFLSRPELKAAADRYDRTRDFKRFVADLAAARPFHNMMRVRYRRPPMRELVREIFADKALGPKALKLFFQHVSDPNAMSLTAQYGKEAGLPKDLVEEAGRRAPAKRAAPAVRTRPALKKMDADFTRGRLGK